MKVKKASYAGRSLAAVLMILWPLAAVAADEPPPRVEVGQEAPSFSLVGSDGKTYSLSDLRGEKDLLLVFFRGSW